jgi:hypothetical protein
MNDMVANNLTLVQSDPALMNALQLRATDLLPRSDQNCAYRAQRKSGSLRNLSRSDPGILI